MTLNWQKISSFEDFHGQSNIKNMENYHKLQDIYDYLDYDKQTLIREPQTQPCGLRNLGNTCYFNVLLQVIYHMNYLRQKICMIDKNPNKFLQTLRHLFGAMCRGKFMFADPQKVFSELRVSYPDTFTPGIQNDFQEVYTLLIEQLEKSFKKISEQEKRAINKLFYGKFSQTTKADISYVKQVNFSVINLDVKQQTFQKALDAVMNYKIGQFRGKGGKITEANVKLSFLQIPALMTFFINRVFYEKGEPVKDSRHFEFEKKIVLSKKSNRKSHIVKQEIDKCEAEKKRVKDWIKARREAIIYIQSTIGYLQSKEYVQLGLPHIDNPHDNKNGLKMATSYLTQELVQLRSKIAGAELQVEKLQQKKQLVAKEHDSEIYTIYAVMIHEGKSAKSGHYKVCINTKDGLWVEFNDRKTSQISYQKIQQYKQRGQICCLFYRRNTLVCDSDKNKISASLKKEVQELETIIKARIDEGRIIQALSQAKETAELLVQAEWNNATKNMHLYFFKPTLHFFSEGKSNEVCKEAILWEQFEGDDFERQVRSRLFDQDIVIDTPVINIELPKEYKQIAREMRSIIIKEREVQKVPSAYADLAKLSKINPSNPLTKVQLINTVGIMFMKGIFYYTMFLDNEMLQLATSMNESLNKIFENMSNKDDFLIGYIPILVSLNQRLENSKKVGTTGKKVTLKTNNGQQGYIGSYADIFSKRFGPWIKRSHNTDRIDQRDFASDSKLYKEYIFDEQNQSEFDMAD